MTPWRTKGVLGLERNGVSLWSIALYSCGVAIEKGLLGSCFDNCTDTLCLFPEYCTSFEYFLHSNILLILSYFIYFDQGRRSCPRASCKNYKVYKRPWKALPFPIKFGRKTSGNHPFPFWLLLRGKCINKKKLNVKTLSMSNTNRTNQKFPPLNLPSGHYGGTITRCHTLYFLLAPIY